MELLGAKPFDGLWSFYKVAVLFAIPSRYPERLGLVFLGAITGATPVVGTNSGGTPEILSDGETGLLVLCL
ncbi:MAG: glycosyltransferase [Candidatus Binataceae bacterium]